MLGLSSGKTSILYKLKDGHTLENIWSTNGFNLEQIERENIILNIRDVGSKYSFQNFWKSYFPDKDALIWVVDSELGEYESYESRTNLSFANGFYESNVPFLILANKQDLPDALNTDEVARKLQLQDIRGRPVQVFATSAVTGFGLEEAIEWLINQLLEADLSRPGEITNL